MNKKYISAFKSAVNRGTPPHFAVSNIAQKSRMTESQIFNGLFKAGVVNRRKFNGSWFYWPNFKVSSGNRNSKKNGQFNFWQSAMQWAITSGYCTPQQISQLKSQKDFFNFFGPFFARQFNWSVSSGWTWSKAKSFGKATKTKASRKSRKTRKSAPKRRTRKSASVRSKSRTRAHKRTRSTRARKSTSRAYKFPRSSSRSLRFRRAA